MSANYDENFRPEFDPELIAIADYVIDHKHHSRLAYETARYCTMDALGCAMLALRFPECAKLLGPLVEGTQVAQGAHVPGTSFVLDPVTASFNLGTMIRWLDFNDTWLAAEWGHPSDNLGGILMLCDYVSRQRRSKNLPPYTMQDVLSFLIKAYEIQGVMALENSFNRVGLDHVILVKLATTAVATQILGCDRAETLNALSLAMVDGQSLRTYRHAPNAGSRKSWAAGDATARGAWLTFMAKKGEMGYPSALSAPQWGFYDVLFKNKPFKFSQAYGDYVMENILFKISYPAEFHAQTAVECAVKLHPDVVNRIDQIQRIVLTTHESAIRIISKQGPLYNPADRDHCLQYMVAIALLYGTLTADHYEDKIALDPRIDALRKRMEVVENVRFSKDYLEKDKRSIANAMKIYFNDGSSTEEIVIEYPIGHKSRRKDGIPLLLSKFQYNLSTHFPEKQAETIFNLCQNEKQFLAMPVSEFVDLWVI